VSLKLVFSKPSLNLLPIIRKGIVRPGDGVINVKQLVTNLVKTTQLVESGNQVERFDKVHSFDRIEKFEEGRNHFGMHPGNGNKHIE
jgi:hypothetical protein